MSSLHSLPTHLIENALKLCGKTMYSVSNIDFERCDEEGNPDANFDWYKFCYYLLSPEFIEKYTYNFSDVDENWNATKFGKAIYQYQSGNKEPLEDLLKKITI